MHVKMNSKHKDVNLNSIDDYLQLSQEIRATMWLLMQVFNIYTKAVERKLAKDGLTAAHWMTLYVLRFIGSPMAPIAISRYLPIEMNSISALLDKLEKRKLIRRRRSRSDRRVVHVYLTEDGDDLATKCQSELNVLTERIFGHLSPDNHRDLRNTLFTIRRNIIDCEGLNPQHTDLVYREMALLPVDENTENNPVKRRTAR